MVKCRETPWSGPASIIRQNITNCLESAPEAGKKKTGQNHVFCLVVKNMFIDNTRDLAAQEVSKLDKMMKGVAGGGA
jgi:hypothetical protein